MKILEKEKAIEFRKLGWAITKIAKELGVAKSSVLSWTGHIVLSEEQSKLLKNKNWKYAQKVNVENCRQRRLDQQKIGKNEINKNNWEHSAGCMLFWAEGSKKRNSVIFTNSNSQMLLFFVNFLRKFYQINNDRISLSFQYHLENEVSEDDIFSHWINFLGLEGCKKQKPYCKPNKSMRKTKFKYGIVRISINDTKIVNRIWGSIQEYIGFNSVEPDGKASVS